MRGKTLLLAVVLLSSTLIGCDSRPISGVPDSGGHLPTKVPETPPIRIPEDAGMPDVGPPRELKWTELHQLTAEQPAGRMNHFAVYDAEKDRMLVLGGYNPYKIEGGCCASPYQITANIWQLDFTSHTWSRLAELDEPLLAFNPSEVGLDPLRNRLVIVGAVLNENYGAAHNFAFDLSTWERTALPEGPWSGSEWPLRVAHDVAGRQMIVHGAFTMDKTEGVWALNLRDDTWRQVPAAIPPSFRFHSPLTCGVAGRPLLFGGYSGEGDTGDLWELDLDGGSWRSVPLERSIRPRWSHRTVFDAARGALLVFGGDRHGVREELGALLIDPVGGTVTEPDLAPAPERRRNHTLVLDSKRRRAVVYGGAFESEFVHSDVWALQLP